MIEGYATAEVYAAEEALMATLDDGELMARAVEGLAAVAAARLEERGATSVVALVGPGNNGADALYAAARLCEAGFGARRRAPRHVHEGARAAAEAAGVVLTTDPRMIAEADLVLDGVLGIGARPGLPDWAVGVGRRRAGDGLRPRGRPAVRAGPGRWRPRPRRRHRRRDGDLLGRQAGASAAGDRAGVRRADRRRHRARGDGRARRAAPRPRRRRRAVAGPGPERRQVLAGGRGRRRRGRVVHGGGRALRDAPPSRRGPGWCATSGPRRPTGSCAPRSPRRRTGSAACRRGSSGRGSTRRRGPRGPRRSSTWRGTPWRGRSRSSSTPVGSTSSTTPWCGGAGTGSRCSPRTPASARAC